MKHNKEVLRSLIREWKKEEYLADLKKKREEYEKIKMKA